ncbi:uncharacterized protein LOC141600883 [Silene latifolia]|uniref:uncharacterized protein LOC141600883 n=1 Tax=Silene latifolia TaxID=37657 RepID=UPI003D78ABD5
MENRGLESSTVFDWDGSDDEGRSAPPGAMLVGKIWASKAINVRAAIDSMVKLWNPKGKIAGNILDPKEKVFLFRFDDERDKTRVLDGQPWHFDKFVWCLNEPQEDGKPVETPLYNLPIWARVYDLPLKGRSNEANLRRIGTQIGHYVGVDEAPFPEMERAVRIRVIHDVRRPLKKAVEIRLSSNKVFDFKIKYEKLPTFCYGCGVLGHGEKDCDEGPYETEELSFGDDLRASPWKVVKTNVEAASKVARNLSREFADEQKRREEV